MLELLRVCLRILPFVAFSNLVIFFISWPLITIAMAIQFLTFLLFPRIPSSEKVEIYLPRLPADVIEHVASYLQGHSDRVRFALASRAFYHSGNAFIYRDIVLDEHPSPNVPWFRRRLYRLHQCLTLYNATYIRHIDFSLYADIDEGYLLSILKKCRHLNSLSLPAIQEPIQSHFERRGVLLKQPVVLTTGLSIPIYSSVTSLIWTGPFIPFRGPAHYAGQHALRLFPNLRSLKMVYRPDSLAADSNTFCTNVYPATANGALSLAQDLKCIAVSCPLLRELIFPFWETIYSRVSPMAFKQIRGLRKIQFLAVDGPMKDFDYGKGLFKFTSEMNEIGVQVNFLNPWKSLLDISSLLDEINFENAEDASLQLAETTELTFGPIGPIRNPWQGREDLLNRLEWVHQFDANLSRRITLVWPITLFEQPTFAIPPIFTGVEFVFNLPVRRGDASQFLKFRQLITAAVEIPHVQLIRVNMKRIDAFYLAFPLFMQFEGERHLILHVERLPLTQKKGFETYWIRRQWKFQRTPGAKEEETSLTGLAKYSIHVHPARLFEKLMVGMLFSGERNVREIICIFQDRYSRS
jgi:hypothetical protein